MCAEAGAGASPQDAAGESRRLIISRIA